LYNITFIGNSTANYTGSSNTWWLNISGYMPPVPTGLNSLDIIFGYNADLIKFEDDGIQFTWRR